MKKRFTVIMVCVCLILAMIPSAAFAGITDRYVEISGTRLEYSKDAVYAVTDDNGAVSYNNANEENYNIKYEDGILYLRNANIVALNTFGIVTSGDTTIVLDGESIVKGGVQHSDNMSESFGIISKGGMLTIKDGDADDTCSLTVSGSSFNDEREFSKCVSVGIYIAGSSSDDEYGLKVESGIINAVGGEAVRFPDEENTYSYGVVSLGGISVTGGTLEAYSGSAYISNAIYADGDIDISGGEVSSTSLNGSFYLDDNMATVYSCGICSSNGNIVISGDDTVVAASGDWAVKSSVGIAADTGSVTINGGSVSVNRSEETYGYTIGDDSISSGIRAAGDVIINGGNVMASGFESYESYGISSINGNITINSNVYAEGGRAGGSGDSAGISTSNGDVIINKGLVYATTSINEGITGTGIYAKGNIFVNGGEIIAMPESNGVDGVQPDYSRGIFSEGGDIAVSGEDTVIYTLGGCASVSSVGMETFGGDIIIQGGTVNAFGFNSYGGENLGLNAAADNEKGGNITISFGNIHLLAKSSALKYSGDLTVTPPLGKKLIVKVLKSVDEALASDDVPDARYEYSLEDELANILKPLADAAQEIKGSPFMETSVVDKAAVSGTQYLTLQTETYEVPEEPEDPAPEEPEDPVIEEPEDPVIEEPEVPVADDNTQTPVANEQNEAEETPSSTPKTGDSADWAMWISFAIMSAAAFAYCRRKMQR